VATGCVSSVDPAVTPGTQTCLLKQSFLTQTGALRTGLSLRTGVLARRRACLVPFAAVTQSSGDKSFRVLRRQFCRI